MTTVAHLNSIVLSPGAYRDGAIVRVNSNHALVAYLEDAPNPRPVVALIDGNGVQVGTWTGDATDGQYWTGGSTTGLYRLADNKILMFRSDAKPGTSGYDLKAYEFDFSDNTGAIPEPVIHTLAYEENPVGPVGPPKWWSGGVGASDGVVLFRINGDYTSYSMHWYQWGSGAMSSALETFAPDPGAYLVGWTQLGNGKALFMHPKTGAGESANAVVDLVTASAADISRTQVFAPSGVTQWIFGPGTPKVEGQSAYTPYGSPGKFVLVDSAYGITEPFTANTTGDYDSGLWNNLGDGYNGVVKIGSQLVLVQTTASTVDFHFDDGTVTAVAQPDGGSFPLGTGQLIGVASGYAALWVTDDSGHVHTFQAQLPPASIAKTPGRIRFGAY